MADFISAYPSTAFDSKMADIDLLKNTSYTEYGSNSNGYYMKYANGAMKCTKTITYTSSIDTVSIANVLWRSPSAINFGNFAAPFIIAPTDVIAISVDRNIIIPKIDNITTTSAGSAFIMWFMSTASSTNKIVVTAWGRWK